MGFRGGGGQIDPPHQIRVFKYPSRDRVNFLKIFTSIGVKKVKVC